MKYPYRDPKTGQFGKAFVSNLPPTDEIQFVCDSQDTHAIREHFGGIDGIAHAYDSFFVVVDNGDYSAVWGMGGVIPYNNKPVYRIV